eukprot:1157983-Pelagomonas_calceolata.AAC.2
MAPSLCLYALRARAFGHGQEQARVLCPGAKYRSRGCRRCAASPAFLTHLHAAESGCMRQRIYNPLGVPQLQLSLSHDQESSTQTSVCNIKQGLHEVKIGKS